MNRGGDAADEAAASNSDAMAGERCTPPEKKEGMRGAGEGSRAYENESGEKPTLAYGVDGRKRVAAASGKKTRNESTRRPPRSERIGSLRAVVRGPPNCWSWSWPWPVPIRYESTLWPIAFRYGPSWHAVPYRAPLQSAVSNRRDENRNAE